MNPKKYVLTISLELDSRNARDDAEARQTAITQLYEWLGHKWNSEEGVDVRLQEYFGNKPPRKVKLS